MNNPLTDDFLNFYVSLAANNDRDWFHAHKDWYIEAVKKPFEAFVQALIDAMREIEPDIDLTPRQAIFRINRDIRFSKDKSPYKLHASAVINTTTRKDYSNPRGFYFEISPEHIQQYGGVYMPDTAHLQQLREHIAAHPAEFAELIADPAFVACYGTVRGEQHKRIPKAFKAAYEQQPLIANKQFYYYAERPAEDITRPDLVQLMMEQYRIARPLNEFLHRAMEA